MALICLLRLFGKESHSTCVIGLIIGVSVLNWCTAPQLYWFTAKMMGLVNWKLHTIGSRSMHPTWKALQHLDLLSSRFRNTVSLAVHREVMRTGPTCLPKKWILPQVNCSLCKCLRQRVPAPWMYLKILHSQDLQDCERLHSTHISHQVWERMEVS